MVCTAAIRTSCAGGEETQRGVAAQRKQLSPSVFDPLLTFPAAAFDPMPPGPLPAPPGGPHPRRRETHRPRNADAGAGCLGTRRGVAKPSRHGRGLKWRFALPTMPRALGHNLMVFRRARRGSEKSRSVLLVASSSIDVLGDRNTDADRPGGRNDLRPGTDSPAVPAESSAAKGHGCNPASSARNATPPLLPDEAFFVVSHSRS